MSQKIIVTGGAGYIGTHTTVALQNAGFDVVVLDNLSNSSVSALDGVARITGVRPDFINVDCADAGALRDAFARHSDAAGVIHFAALKAVGESVEKPLMYFRNNLNGLINVLDMMREFNIPNIVFSSSATVYGVPDKLPVTEETPLQPATSPYGATKVMGENIIRDTVRAYPQLRATLLRYFNPIGAHPSGLIGELPNGVPNNLMPYITQTAAGVREYLSVFGDDYDTPDGYCVRDYIDVNDLARAHVAALRHMLNGVDGVGVFNLGTGRGVSVMELVRGFEVATGVPVPYKIAPRRAGDVPAIWADASLAERVLGWRAETPLADTLASAWRWQENQNKN
ncbi:MAG: UDP-glucose 4-epimerase GalE [Alphaproteobacteria bacterium]|nr:UDP-glucose 4-epimerase GalE [Alphaproteobacteria bacterium]MBQ7127460.1 UDP-glucose 4-epimerase GalE [Alphaproteobacteria bacterium]